MTDQPKIAVELTAYELAQVTLAMWNADTEAQGGHTNRFSQLRERFVQARVALFAANPSIEEYDHAKLEIDRVRYSTTQGHVRLSYAGTELNVYGDAIKLRDGDWKGHDDQYWHEVARRDAGRAGLCG